MRALKSIFRSFIRKVWAKVDPYFVDWQEERVASAYRDGYLSAARQFKEELDLIVNEKLSDIRAKYESEIEVIEKHQPMGYDFISMRPLGTVKTVRIPKCALIINITPKKEFLRVYEFDKPLAGEFPH